MLAKTYRVLALVLMIGLVAVGNSSISMGKDPEKKAVSLFDGKTLEGWKGNAKYFHVADGAIICGTLKEKIPRNYFLSTDKEYQNFDLTLKFRFASDNTNSGVQIRSERHGKDGMKGYQADLGNGYWGTLYDEERRNKILIQMDQKEAIKLVNKKDGEWNDYRVLCEGKRIQIWLNGKQTVDYTEKEDEFKGEKISDKGHIGLQIHSGGPSEAWFKDIKIIELP
jgi:hypothetical protein